MRRKHNPIDLELRQRELSEIRKRRKISKTSKYQYQLVRTTTSSGPQVITDCPRQLWKNKPTDNETERCSIPTRRAPMPTERKILRKPSSKYTGVCFNKNARKWTARLQKPGDKEKTYLGIYATEEEAALVVLRYAKMWDKKLRCSIEDVDIEQFYGRFMKSPVDWEYSPRISKTHSRSTYSPREYSTREHSPRERFSRRGYPYDQKHMIYQQDQYSYASHQKDYQKLDRRLYSKRDLYTRLESGKQRIVSLDFVEADTICGISLPPRIRVAESPHDCEPIVPFME